MQPLMNDQPQPACSRPETNNAERSAAARTSRTRYAARYQAQLDRWFGEQRAIAAEERRLKRDLDPYNLSLYDDDFMFVKKG